MSQIQRQKEPGCQKLRGVTANRYSFTWGKCKSSGDEWSSDDAAQQHEYTKCY